ncbi:unnamed protein product, partial [Mesorhabditis belari]|uniref:Uncharacterized protein n=1 Tax=Mesorhabditis belari TaxID=2138241 RepID=A0AAF3ERP4_9BILA
MKELQVFRPQDDGSSPMQAFHASLSLVIAMCGLTVLSLILHILALIFTIIGFRRRIRAMGYAYHVYLISQFMMWFNTAANGIFMQVSEFFWVGAFLLMSSAVLFIVMFWRAKRIFVPMFPDPQYPQFAYSA